MYKRAYNQEEGGCADPGVKISQPEALGQGSADAADGKIKLKRLA